MTARVSCDCGWTAAYPSPTAAEFNARRHVCRERASIRRATRRHRCARCGLVAVYENAGAAEARYWFGRHSCRKRELALLRHAQAEGREALVDRTPQPCLHKVAAHEHGTRTCYVLDRCRCLPCSEANSAAERDRERQKAYGRYNKYVPAEFVRDHLAELKDYGIGLKRVSELSGVSNGSLTKIWYGLYADTGRGHERRLGEGQLVRGSSRRVLRKTAEAVYAVEPIPANLGSKRTDPRGPIARAHLRSLVALGWSMSELGRRLGMKHVGNAITLITSDRPISRATVDQVEALFEQLAMTPPPETNQRQRISASQARRFAREHGWLPPLALDDFDVVHDQPDDATSTLASSGLEDVDEVAIQRRMGGDKSVRLNAIESAELVCRWRASGRPMNECGRVTGLKPERYYARAEVEDEPIDNQEASAS